MMAHEKAIGKFTLTIQLILWIFLSSNDRHRKVFQSEIFRLSMRHEFYIISRQSILCEDVNQNNVVKGELESSLTKVGGRTGGKHF